MRASTYFESRKPSQKSMSHPIFTLGEPPDLAAFDRLQTELLEAIEDGAKAVAIDLDALAVLDSAAMRQLIKLLRRTRERGAELSLITGRPEILRSLKVTALDKVFHVTAPHPQVAA